MVETDYTVESVQQWWKNLQTSITNAEQQSIGRETEKVLASKKSFLEHSDRTSGKKLTIQQYYYRSLQKQRH